MFTNLINNLNAYLPFSEDEMMFFLSLFEFKRFKKNETILSNGEICRHVSYINKGLVRYYYVANDKEYTLRIFPENEWFSEYESFLSRKPSALCITALEDTEAFTLTFDAVQKGYNKGKVFERFGRLMAENLFLDTVRRISNQKAMTPEEQYRDMIEKTPELLGRIPIKYIANMLGIEPESLSRIRRRMAGKN